MASGKSKFLIWVQIVIGAIAVAWFSYDFFHTFVNGLTYTLRFDARIEFSQSSAAFVVAVLIKLLVYGFFLWLIKDCFKKLKAK